MVSGEISPAVDLQGCFGMFWSEKFATRGQDSWGLNEII